MPYLDETPLSIPAQRRLRPSWIARSKGLPESYPTRRQASSEVTLGRNAEGVKNHVPTAYRRDLAQLD